MKKGIANFVVIPLLITIILFRVPSVFAQESSAWSPQQRIPGYNNDTSPPILIADQNRVVHAFFSQWSSPPGESDIRVIMYNQWTVDQGWTNPVDILMSPLKSEARLLDAFLDKTGRVHVIFWGGDNTLANIYYSSAKIADAQNTQAWSVPILAAEDVQDPENGAFYIDEQNNYVILYAGKSQGSSLFTTSSGDDGATWSKPTLVLNAHDNNNFINNLSIFRSDSGTIDAIWNEITVGGQGRGIYYSRKESSAGKWSNPVNLAESTSGYGTNTPAIIEYQNVVYAFYNLGGVIWQRTYDGVKDWTPSVQLFPQHIGVNGTLSLVIDGSDKLHIFFGQRIPGNPDIHGMWESDLLDNNWSIPEAVVSGPRVLSGNNKSFDPFDAHAVVSQGNIILVTWRTDPGNGVENENGVWFSYRKLDIPPSPETEPLIQNTVPATPTVSITESSQSSSTLNTEPTKPNQPVYNFSGSIFSSNPINTILLSAILSILIVLAISTITIYYRRHLS